MAVGVVGRVVCRPENGGWVPRTRMVAAPLTKEGWRLPFRALVPRVDPISNDGAVGRFAGDRKEDRGPEEGRSRTRGESRQVPRGTDALSPTPKLGGSDWVHTSGPLSSQEGADRRRMGPTRCKPWRETIMNPFVVYILLCAADSARRLRHP
jgi:hypothetical protein